VIGERRGVSPPVLSAFAGDLTVRRSPRRTQMDTQLLSALLLTTLAASYLIWSVVRSVLGRGKPGCGGCGSCAAAKDTPGGSTTFLPVEELTMRSSR
jgi:hypothetical protein